MNTYDLIVVGAGFAGLSCAQSAQAAGLRTLVIDRKRFAGESMHTTGILVKEVAEHLAYVPTRLTRKISRVRLYSPRLDTLELSSPDYYFLASDTPALMHYFSEQSENAGVRVNYATPYRGIQQNTSLLELVSHDCQTSFLVGADGARSKVAKSFNFDQSQRFLFGLEAEFDEIKQIDDDCLHVFIDNQLSPGYISWVVPGVNAYQVGLAAKHPYRPSLDKLLAKLKQVFQFPSTTPRAYRAGFIPVAGPNRQTYNHHAMLLGDAAGMVSPLTAGGIHPAIEIGNAAGHAIADYVLSQGPNPGQVLRKLTPRYFFKRKLRALYDYKPLRNQTIERLFQSTLFRTSAQTLFFHHRGLFSLKAWRDIWHTVRTGS